MGTEGRNPRRFNLRRTQRVLFELLHLTVTQYARRRARHQQKVAACTGHKYSQPLVKAARFRRLLAALLLLLDIEGIVDVPTSASHIRLPLNGGPETIPFVKLDARAAVSVAAYIPFSVGKPFSNQSALKFSGSARTRRWVNPIWRSAANAGRTFGHLSNGQHPQ